MEMSWYTEEVSIHPSFISVCVYIYNEILILCFVVEKQVTATGVLKLVSRRSKLSHRMNLDLQANKKNLKTPKGVRTNILVKLKCVFFEGNRLKSSHYSGSFYSSNTK